VKAAVLILIIAALLFVPATAAAPLTAPGVKHVIADAGQKRGHRYDHGHDGRLVLVITRPERLGR
jgi:hypothetical protein